MNASGLLKDLFRHMEWADALVWSVAFEAPALIDDDSARERLYHIHLVQRAFLHVWRGEEMHFEGTDALRGRSLARWGRDYHADVRLFLSALEEPQLDDMVHLPWSARVMERFGTDITNPSLGETLAQVASHSAYHRGQVNARFRELGVEPPLTDFIAWVWSGKPAPAWPSGTD